MKEYLLLVKGSFADWNKLTESQRKDFVAQFGQYAQELHKLGYLKNGDGCSERSFRIYSQSVTVSDALIPAQTKDMVTGYFMLEVPSEEEAFNIAKKCPAFQCGEYVELVSCGH